MRLLSRLTLLLCLLPTPAEAACHVFRYWAYPFPQRCGQLHPPALLRRDVMIPLPDLTAITWEVPVSRELWDGVLRRQALLRLTQ
jgi:hypothetical protein